MLISLHAEQPQTQTSEELQKRRPAEHLRLTQTHLLTLNPLEPQQDLATSLIHLERWLIARTP